MIVGPFKTCVYEEYAIVDSIFYNCLTVIKDDNVLLFYFHYDNKLVEKNFDIFKSKKAINHNANC